VTREMIDADLRMCFLSVKGRCSGALTLMKTIT
jgi:hypothetical protein